MNAMNVNSTVRNWVKNPTGKEAAISFIAWLVGLTLVLLAGTDFFRENFFVQRNLAVGFLIISATIIMLIVVINLIRKRQ